MLLKLMDTLLWIAILFVVIMAFIDGRFIHNEVHIIETCNYEVITHNGKPTNITLPEQLQPNTIQPNKNLPIWQKELGQQIP